MDVPIEVPPPRLVRLVVDVEPGSQPIRGTTSEPGRGGPVPFEGWIELAARLEAVRSRGATPPPVP